MTLGKGLRGARASALDNARSAKAGLQGVGNFAKDGLEIGRRRLTSELSHVPTFAKLPEATILRIQQAMTERAFSMGETIIKKGQDGTTFFMIKSGVVGFDLNDNGQIQSTRTDGEYFGEISLLNAGQCTATVVAQTDDCVCYALSRDDFNKLGVVEHLRAKAAQRRH